MGWSGGTDIILELATSLIQEGVHPDARRRIYDHMVDRLQDKDWDTEDEALGADPQLDSVLYEACPGLKPEGRS